MREEKGYRWLKNISTPLEVRTVNSGVPQRNLLLTVLGWSFFLLFFAGSCADKSSSIFTDAELERISLAQRINLVEQAGGLVLVVGGETITSDDVIQSSVEHGGGTVVLLMEALKPAAQMSDIEQFKKQARGQLEEIVTAKISDILLYHLAKSRAGEQIDEALEKAADAELRRFVLSFGGDEAKADEKLKQIGMDRKSFRKNQKRLILAQSEITSKMSDNSPITYRELTDCYNQMKDEFFVIPARVQFRLIDIQPAMLEVADPNEDRQLLARELAHKLLAQLQAGEDFGELAMQYSHGPMRQFGGLWKPMQPQSLAAPYDRLVDEIEKTKPGEIADLIETPGHIFIMKLEQKYPESYKPLEEVQRQVEQKIVSDRWNKVVDKLNAGLTKHAALGEKDEFIDFCLEKIYRLSSQ